MPRPSSIVVDIGFGDGGKGAVVDSLARKRRVDWVVRFNGGAQAAHNVVAPDGTHHCFHQFGSALLASPSTKTFLSKDVLFDPFMARKEEEELAKLKIRTKLCVSPDALVVTPWHVSMNQIRETARSDSRHGSCGMGIGETRQDSLLGKPAVRVRDLLGPDLRAKLQEVFAQKLEDMREFLQESDIPDPSPMAKILLDPSQHRTVLENVLSIYTACIRDGVFECADEEILRGKEIVFEGAQGILLDERVGFLPYVTWTDTTPHNALEILKSLGMDGEVVGVTRAFGVRHGAGPFPAEDSSTRKWALHTEHNARGPWQGTFRTGWFDFPLARHALLASSLDKLVITCIDRLERASQIKAIQGYAEGEAFLVPPERGLPSCQVENVQMEITKRLQNVEPVVREYRSPEELVSDIREKLGVKEGWDSHSPSSRIRK